MIITSLLALAQASAPAGDYHVEIRPQDGASAEVFITLHIEGDSDGETMLQLPSSWGGEDELWRGFTGISVQGGTLQPADPETPTKRVVTHDAGADLTIRWQIIQDREGTPSAAARDNYRPWLQPSYVHLLGQTIFLRAERDSNPQSGDMPVSVNIDVGGDWALASDLEIGSLPYDRLGASVIVVGDFRVSEQIIDGAPVRVAVRGEMSDAQIMSVTRSAVEGNLAYWGDAGEPYLVTALPIEVEPGRSSFGGTNMRDAFAIFGTNNVPDEIIARVLVHEHSHSWVPGRMGTLTQGPEQPQDYWFSEGFTDFVTTRAGLMSGAWDAEAAIGQLNEFLAEYMASPAREDPNTAIRDGFWSSAEHQRLPYLRGNLFALLVDQHIHAETNGAHSLDDVLFAMRDAPEQGLVAHTFVDFVFEVTGLDITELHQRHIIEGETIILPANTFGSCGVVESGLQPVFVYGMELGANPDGEGSLVTAVDPDGPAAAGGFAPGMVLLERVAGAVGDATQHSAFRLLDLEGNERVMSYRPTNGRMEMSQRIVPANADLMTNGCLERLAGRAL